ncbi:CysS/YqeB C-terminal domain-containing protein [Dactylosporangium sp. NBC_01737]|uniref:CysS/YqeB C-terminal domain-containing protein n=1 Tax=Dactylosporangium sp. NBC_01737 TaxID=2975959 RepID=UPI003FA3C677
MRHGTWTVAWPPPSTWNRRCRTGSPTPTCPTSGSGARAALRRMLVRLGTLGRLAPLVTALLDWRSTSRAAGDWAVGDAIREVLRTAGVSVRDTPAGPSWSVV